MSDPIVSITCLHSVEEERSVVRFRREKRGGRQYIPTALSVRRLALWLEQGMFCHSFFIGRCHLEVFIVPNRED